LDYATLSEIAAAAEMLRTLQALTMACVRAGFRGQPLDPAHEENLAKLDGYSDPSPDFSASLRRLAAGHHPFGPRNQPSRARTGTREDGCDPRRCGMQLDIANLKIHRDTRSAQASRRLAVLVTSSGGGARRG
jgi:hypothetical protein